MCVCIYVYVYNIYVFVCMYVCMSVCKYMCVCVYICACVCVYVCVYVYVYVCLPFYLYISIHLSTWGSCRFMRVTYVQRYVCAFEFPVQWLGTWVWGIQQVLMMSWGAPPPRQLYQWVTSNEAWSKYFLLYYQLCHVLPPGTICILVLFNIVTLYHNLTMSCVKCEHDHQTFRYCFLHDAGNLCTDIYITESCISSVWIA